MLIILDIKYINIGAERLSALSSVHQLQMDYSSVDNSTLQRCMVHDGASDDRADKCSISGYYRHRKRYLVLHTTTTDKQCEYKLCMSVSMYVITYLVMCNIYH